MNFKSIDPPTASAVLRTVLENTENLFAAIDTEYRLLAFNKHFADEFKKVYGTQVTVGAKLHDLLNHLPKEEKQKVLDFWGRGLAGEEFFITQEFGELKRKNYEIRFYSIKNDDGLLVGTFQLVQDVSDKKLLLHHLSHGESKLHNLFDHIPSELRIFAEAMPQMAFIADKQGNITYYNQRHYDYFGIKDGDSKDWKWTETNMHHPEDLPVTIAKWAESIQKGTPYEMEYRLRRYDGTYRWHLARALPIKDSEGEIVRWVGTNTDIDEQKKAAHQLNQLLKEVKYEKSRFEAVVKQMPAAVIIGEAPSGKLIYANDKMAEVWGHELIPSKDINEYVKWVGFHPDGRSYQAQEWPLARSITHGEVVHNEDVEIQRHGGSRAILRLSSTPLYNDAGEIIAGVVICQDVTELKDAIRSRDEFLSICSHELKTPLTSLKLASQGVLRNIKKGDLQALSPEKMSRVFNQTDLQVNRLSRLVEDMLDISRISSNRLSLDIRPFDLCQLLRDVVERMSPAFEEAGATLSMQNCEPTLCQGDIFRIEQVISNLLSNAIKYGDKKPVAIRSYNENGYAVFCIKDRGKGIAKENQDLIFNRYERLVTANEVSGLGLGLYITKKIVELHNGKIWLESKLGSGSTFCVGLPTSE